MTLTYVGTDDEHVRYQYDDGGDDIMVDVVFSRHDIMVDVM